MCRESKRLAARGARKRKRDKVDRILAAVLRPNDRDDRSPCRSIRVCTNVTYGRKTHTRAFASTGYLVSLSPLESRSLLFFIMPFPLRGHGILIQSDFPSLFLQAFLHSVRREKCSFDF